MRVEVFTTDVMDNLRVEAFEVATDEVGRLNPQFYLEDCARF